MYSYVHTEKLQKFRSETHSSSNNIFLHSARSKTRPRPRARDTSCSFSIHITLSRFGKFIEAIYNLRDRYFSPSFLYWEQIFDLEVRLRV